MTNVPGSERAPQRSEEHSVTDADRAALEALRPFLKSLGITELMLILEAIARARAEGAAELDAERAAHEATKARLALAEATIDTLEGFTEHGSECVLSRWEAGRPKPDGGYEWKYAGTWYDMDRLPACECELGPAIAAWRAAK